MSKQTPETFGEYFKLQLKKLGRWVTPDPSDPFLVTVLKTIYKAVAILILLAFSPVLILSLFIAFVTAF